MICYCNLLCCFRFFFLKLKDSVILTIMVPFRMMPSFPDFSHVIAPESYFSSCLLILLAELSLYGYRSACACARSAQPTPLKGTETKPNTPGGFVVIGVTSRGIGCLYFVLLEVSAVCSVPLIMFFYSSRCAAVSVSSNGVLDICSMSN